MRDIVGASELANFDTADKSRDVEHCDPFYVAKKMGLTTSELPQKTHALVARPQQAAAK